MMKTRVINHCQVTYRPLPEKTICQILRHVPGKFLIGLDEIRILETRPQKTLQKSCVWKKSTAQSSVIEVYMDDSLLSGVPLFSRLFLNLVFLSALNEHIQHCVQPYSSDEDILFYDPSKVNLRWRYLGVWEPAFYVFKLGNFLVSGSKIIQRFLSLIIKRIINRDTSKK